MAYNSSLQVGATNILVDACLAAGQRAIVGETGVTLAGTHGNREDSTETSLQGSMECLQYVANIDRQRSLVRPSVMPRGQYCPPDLMAGLGRQSENHTTYCQVHICETQADIEQTLKLHDDFCCHSDMYKAYGLFRERAIAAHCIHLTTQDMINLKSCRAGVAHNTNSNTCLCEGECRVRDLLDAGIKVGLGTDCSAGYMPSIHDAMRSAANCQ